MPKGRKPKTQNLEFAERMSKLLRLHKLTQRDCAKICGVSVSVINGWLNGTSPSDAKCILKLCETLSLSSNEQVDFQELLTGKKSNYGVTIATEADLTKLFTSEAEIFNGYIHLIAKRVTVKKKEEK